MTKENERSQILVGNEIRNNKKMSIAIMLKKNIILIITLIGVSAGIIMGYSLRHSKLSETTVLLISYPGELYMRLLKLLILPLIISSLITGTSSVNARLNGKIAMRTFIYFFLTSAFNASLGVILAILIHPGDPGLKITLNKVVDNKNGNSVLDSLLDLGRNLIAENIFQATFQQAHTDYVNSTTVISVSNKTILTKNKMEKILNYRLGTNNIGLVFFCIIFGSILGAIGPKGKVVKDLFLAVFEITMRMVKSVIWLTPIGVCSIITAKIILVDDIYLVISQLGWFILTILIGILLYQLVIMQLIYFLIVRKNPFKYYCALVQGTLTAFATASAAAALPINFEVMDNVLKIHSSITRFVMPIGTNINMNGTALFLAVATIFMAQMNSFYLGAGTLVTIWVTSTILSFSSASVPSAAIVLLLMIISSIGIPADDLPLLFAIDWLVDRIRTTNNMLGDCYTAAIVEKLSKKELLDITNNQTPEEVLTLL
ncbi:excitatory amino acid transporter 2 [Diorhabda carinulata]|uniref:excitatory amino acid transporter 2 n=1 Tax=Diorhabda carinulata TaxID=1163345 RepID=UPI0025A172AE|nr:excitatory amino acid transporter 2 [Diorhabda carinulata]